jgi:hypothetical protein
VNLRSPNRLCAPSDKRGEDPTAASDPEHLVSFPEVGSSVRVSNQEIANQFGTVKLDLIRRSFLFVPTLKSLVGPAPDLTNPTTDHFQCYLVRRSTGEPRFAAIRGVTGVDQFGSHAMDLLRPRFFCAPANKNNEDPSAVNHQQGLLCYKARHRIRFPTLEPFINNQFVDQEVTITRRMEFCVPSTIVTD